MIYADGAVTLLNEVWDSNASGLLAQQSLYCISSTHFLETLKIKKLQHK